MKPDQIFYSGLRKEWGYVISRGREIERGFWPGVCIRRGNPVRNACEENLSDTVSGWKKTERSGGLSELHASHAPFLPYMMLAVTVATKSFLGQKEVTSMWCYHETDLIRHSYTEEVCTCRVIRSYDALKGKLVVLHITPYHRGHNDHIWW